MHPAEIMMLESALDQIDSASRTLRKFIILAKSDLRQQIQPTNPEAPLNTPLPSPEDEDPIEAAVNQMLSSFDSIATQENG